MSYLMARQKRNNFISSLINLRERIKGVVMENELPTINFRIATLIGMLVIIVQGAYWIGMLSERVNNLERGNHTATKDRWTKLQDDARHENVQAQLKHIQDDIADIKQILKERWVRP